MKPFLLFLLISFAFSLLDIQHHQKIVDTVNNLKTTWKAKLYNRDITLSLGSLKETSEFNLPDKTTFEISNDDLPSSYDLREKYPECESIQEILD